MATRRVLPFLLAAAAGVLAQADSDPKAVATAFTDAQIVPDVVASFAPTLAVQLTFDHQGFKIPVNAGVLLTINQTAKEPAIALKSDTPLTGKAYLVAMVDPDAPTPQNKNVSEVRHWLAPNFVAGAAAADGTYPLVEAGAPVGKYAGPGPAAPSDPHRYTVLVFEQPTAQIDAPTGNAVAPFLNFNLTAYVASIPGLTLVGGTFLRVGPLGTVPNNGTASVPAGETNGTTGGNSTTGSGNSTTGGSDAPGAAAVVRVGWIAPLALGALAALALF